MELKLTRRFFSDKGTIGTLDIDGEQKYYIMEDKDRKLEIYGCSAKIPKETAIPRGRYRVIIDFSNRFQKMMPHVLGVLCFDGIRIHVGNFYGDTEGCLLIGTGYSLSPEYMVTNSRKAFAEFFPLLEAALEKEECWLEVL
jgi:hypothetical protein